MEHPWTTHPDGSIDLTLPGLSLVGGYPGLDGRPIRPLSVRVFSDGASKVAEYQLAEGLLTLTLDAKGGSATLDATLAGMTNAPESVEVFGWADASGVRRVFKQSHGIGGGSGIKDLSTEKSVESSGVTGLIEPGGSAVVVYSEDHTRFEQRTWLWEGRGNGPGTRLMSAFQTERIALRSSALRLPTLFFRHSTDPWLGMRAAARAIATTMNARPVRPATYHWCSWYYLYQNLDMPLLSEYLDGMNRVEQTRRMDFVQIDAGYFPALGDWLPPSHRFPGTVKPAFDRIKSAGYRPGIWIGPFMVGNRSRLAAEHPDWLLRRPNGELITHWRNYGEQRVWGARDEEAYALDTSHPAAFEYLRQTFRTLRGWGAEMFKTDFMYWGLENSAHVARHTPGKTGVEYFREVLQMIREEIGPDTFWLGCIAPYLPFVGYADAMRIGGDVGEVWDGGFSMQNMLQETVGNQHFNQLFWQNDPDVMVLRDFHTRLTRNEVHALAMWQAILGGVVATSDPLHEIAPDRLALWRFVAPPANTRIVRLPFIGDKDRPLVAVREVDNGASVILILNITERPITQRLRLADLGLPGKWVLHQREVTHTDFLGELDEVLVEIQPHSARLLHASHDRTPPTGPMLS